MLSVAEARARILSHFQPVAAETLPLPQCANRILAVDIIAPHDFPPFDNSAMDGFAIRADDSNLTLNVVADIAAGSAPEIFIAQGQAARIMTGAQMPAGADAVIPVEDSDFHSRNAGTVAPQTVSFSRVAKIGGNVRRRGTDFHAGDVVLKNGRVIKPQDLGLLAMLGIANVAVYKKPRVALLSSGDELLEVDAPLTAGKIYDANSYAFAALIQNAGAEVISLGIAKDSRQSVEEHLKKALDENADVIISTAGVSVGAFDFVKEVLEAYGKLDFWRVNMKPGKPLAFGEYRGVPFFGLPGNPVSAFVGFVIFVGVALEKLSGQTEESRVKVVKVKCEEEILSDGRESYLRVKIRAENGGYIATLTGHQGSGNLLSLTQANALLIIPAGVKCVAVSQEADALLL